MILLDNSTTNLKVETSAAGSIDVIGSFVDVEPAQSMNPVAVSASRTAISSAGTYTVVAGPTSAGRIRNVVELGITFKSTNTTTTVVTIFIDSGGQIFELYSARLGPGESIHYIDLVGFVVYRRPETWRAYVGYASADDVEIGTGMTSIASASFDLMAGDALLFELYGHVRNDSGATKTNIARVSIGSFSVDLSAAATVATATDTPISVFGGAGIHSTTLSHLVVHGALSPAAAGDTAVSAGTRGVWGTSTSDLTGLQTVTLAMQASDASNTAGALFRLAGYTICRCRDDSAGGAE